MSNRRTPRPYHPAERGSAASPQVDGPIHSVRPPAYLIGVRCLGVPSLDGTMRAATARDHALLETLVSLARRSFLDLRAGDGGKLSSGTVGTVVVPFEDLVRWLGQTGRRRDIRATLSRLAASRWAFPGSPVICAAVTCWKEDVDHVHVDLALPLERMVMAAFTRADPHRYLDLRAMWSLRGGGSSVLFRRLVGLTPRPSGAPERQLIELDWYDVAEACGVRAQVTGGFRNLVEATVLKQAAKDFARLDASEISIRLRWRDDGERFLSHVEAELNRPLAPLRRLKSVRLSAGHDGRSPVPTLHRELRWITDRPDAPGLKTSISAWAKLKPLLRISDGEMHEVSRAWGQAIDEMLHSGDRVWGRLTPGADTRLFRGERLRAVIDAESIDRALLLWAWEEHETPDLTHGAVQASLIGYERFFLRDRKERCLCTKIDARREASTPSTDPEAWARRLAQLHNERDKRQEVKQRLAKRGSKPVLTYPQRRERPIFSLEEWTVRQNEAEAMKVSRDRDVAAKAEALAQRKAEHFARKTADRNLRRRTRYAKQRGVTTVETATLHGNLDVKPVSERAAVGPVRTTSSVHCVDDDLLIERRRPLRLEERLELASSTEERDAILAASAAAAKARKERKATEAASRMKRPIDGGQI